MRRLHHMGLASALALLAADAATAGGADSIEKSDPTPQPQPADQTPPQEPQPDPAPGAVGNAAKGDPNPPTKKATAEKEGKKTYIVWAQPGHETIGVGQILTTTPEEAELLRAAGRARYASEAEVKAAKAVKGDNAVILDLTGI